jgi:hypothetical protein
MKRLVFILTCVVALVVPVAVLASGGEGGFDGVVRSIERTYHVHATRIPFLGLISFVARRATGGGVSNMHVAEFENFSATVDGEELNQMVSDRLGPEWQRMVRETSRNGHSQTLIFAHPEGNRMGLFVLDADGNELDVVQVSVDPAHLDDDIGHYKHHQHRDDPGGED